jgi:biotin carboxylase
VGLPVIIKPLTEAGGHGVVKADTLADLENHVSGDRPHSELPPIVQKYLPGFDAGISFLAADGRILGRSLQRDHPFDGSIEFFRSGEIEEFGVRFARLTGYTGVANIDLRVDGVFRLLGMIECNPRFWNSIVPSRIHGLNFAKAGVDLALGADPETLNVGDYREGTYNPPEQRSKGGLPIAGHWTGLTGRTSASWDIRPWILCPTSTALS